MVMDMDFSQRGELSQYESLRLVRSFFGVGSFELTLSAHAPCADSIDFDRVLYIAEATHKAMVVEEIIRTRDRLTVRGVPLKGLCKRRVAVPPLSLPTTLWQYTASGWVQVTTDAAKRAALETDSVYEGYTRPETQTVGTYWLDLTQQAAVYDWGSTSGVGEVWMDQTTAVLRDKYKNFGWDRYTGPAESAYLHYAANNLTAPEDTSRALPGMVLATDQARGMTLPWQARFDKLADLFEDIGQATGLGWDIRPDMANHQLVFQAVQGTDRSTGTGMAIVSEQMGNSTTVTRTRSRQTSASNCYVGGTGEDENRLILCVGEATTGLARRELWAEAGSVEDTDMLRLYGQNKLDAAAAKDSLTADVISIGASRYERDYDLGDKVLLVGAGAQTAARLTEVTEVYEGGKRSISCVFGDAPVTAATIFGRATRAAAR